MKLKKTLKKSGIEEVNESIISIKNTIIDTLKEESQNIQNKPKKIEEQFLEIDQKSSHLDQYSRRNNMEIQGIPELVASVLN